MKETKTKIIKCEMCGKEIEKKNNRVLCVKCTNKKNREARKIHYHETGK